MPIRLLILIFFCALTGAFGAEGAPDFPAPLSTYGDAGMEGIGAKLMHRAKTEPFNIVATLVFVAAIVHTFLVARFRHMAHDAEHELSRLEGISGSDEKRMDRLRFRCTAYHFLGEVEAVFGIWLIPLFIAIAIWKGFGSAVHYLDNVNYAEAIFVTVIMIMAATKPVLALAETGLGIVARMLGGTPVAWWLSILTVGPLLGSFITEPAAMTLCALLLAQRFYTCKPPMRLRYATLGLLFVNISVGGTLTHFAAPPVVMVAGKWGYGLSHMMMNFGWKAIVGILIANFIYWLAFRRDLSQLTAQAPDEKPARVPFLVTLTHLGFLAWTVMNAHHPALVILGLLFFLAYVTATPSFQDDVAIRGPLLVGFFLAALVAHGGLQQWWIEPVLGSLGPWPLMAGSTVLTAFNDNAAITYLASLVPGFSEPMKYAVLAGAVTGGGLTVIANAPNPAGQSILQRYFGEDGISPLGLVAGALVPTVIMGAAFMLL